MASVANSSNSPPADFWNPNVPDTVANWFKTRDTEPLTAKARLPETPDKAEAPVTEFHVNEAAPTPPVELLEPLAPLYFREALVTDIVYPLGSPTTDIDAALAVTPIHRRLSPVARLLTVANATARDAVFAKKPVAEPELIVPSALNVAPRPRNSWRPVISSTSRSRLAVTPEAIVAPVTVDLVNESEPEART